ncbi:MAG: iron-containing alcohol dehydrogenase [Actinomycetota bacterium]|nr:iron-containing alcohol dehydrogenase [Actinomycetota bacterium]
MATRSITVPALLDIRAGALSDLSQTLERVFNTAHVVVACGTAGSAESGQQAIAGLVEQGSHVTVVEALGGTLKAAYELEHSLDELQPTIVVAVGGGRTIDTAKLAANRAGVPFVAAPTTLAHDGMASPVASLAGEDGVRRSLAAGMPAGVVIDLDVVGSAPEEFVRAGIGDLVSNLTAVADWRLAAAAGQEPIDEFAASIALQSALPALSVEWPVVGDDLHLVARGLVMSGLAMEVAGSSRPCSGAEHLISHALDQLLGSAARAHGDQVALGVLLVAKPSGVDVGRLRHLYARIGLPTTLAGWEVDRSTLVEAIRLGPSTRPGRVTVLDRLDLSDGGIDQLLADAFDGAET